jgi:hypothetical protein
MVKPWSIIRVLVAGALSFPGYCSASGSNDAILYNELTECIDLQFEGTPAPESFSEIDLAADCPELLLSLAGSIWVDKTSLANHDYPNLAQLADLRYFLGGAFHPPVSGWIPDLSRLESILAETLDTEDRDRGQSWWERLLYWLRQRHKGRDEADLRWLEAWLEKLALAETTAEYIAYGVSALLILVAVGLVLNEVRLVRQGRPERRPRNSARGDPAGATAVTSGTPSEVQSLPRNAPELLNVCIDYLIQNRRLPEARSRTNREFLRHLYHTGDSAAPGFHHLLQQAECALYGDRPVDAYALQQCHRKAAALLGATDNSHPATAATG